MEPNAMANNQGGAMNDVANAFKRMRAQPNTFGAPQGGPGGTQAIEQNAMPNNMGNTAWQSGGRRGLHRWLEPSKRTNHKKVTKGFPIFSSPPHSTCMHTRTPSPSLRTRR